MSKALETLMAEHRVIEQVLSSLETFAERLEDDRDPRRALSDYGRFFREFADRCHHAKEEDRLFVEMVRHGFPREHGPIAVMLSDHVEGRAHVGAIAKAGEGTGPLSAAECSSVRYHVRTYVPLLRSHIMKEDNVLYPMAGQALPAEVLEKLAREFEEHEHGTMGEGTHEELHGLAERLLKTYPPSATEKPGSSCFGCASHAGEVGR
jgi:hemerythrin-like domain-containing protein